MGNGKKKDSFEDDCGGGLWREESLCHHRRRYWGDGKIFTVVIQRRGRESFPLDAESIEAGDESS